MRAIIWRCIFGLDRLPFSSILVLFYDLAQREYMEVNGSWFGYRAFFGCFFSFYLSVLKKAMDERGEGKEREIIPNDREARKSRN